MTGAPSFSFPSAARSDGTHWPASGTARVFQAKRPSELIRCIRRQTGGRALTVRNPQIMSRRLFPAFLRHRRYKNSRSINPSGAALYSAGAQTGRKSLMEVLMVSRDDVELLGARAILWRMVIEIFKRGHKVRFPRHHQLGADLQNVFCIWCSDRFPFTEEAGAPQHHRALHPNPEGNGASPFSHVDAPWLATEGRPNVFDWSTRKVSSAGSEVH